MTATAPSLHVDDALQHLVTVLAAVPASAGKPLDSNARHQGCEVWVAHVVQDYWQSRGVRVNDLDQWEGEPYFRPFYDAAWELCRRGILRPGMATTPRGVTGSGFHGDGYSLTEYGRMWAASAAKGTVLPSDPARMAQVFTQHAARFGAGFVQRATEGAACYRMGNYLSCCVMAGAAAESILLATAIAKAAGSEKPVLEAYRRANGRKAVLDMIVGQATPGVAEQFNLATGVLAYWRDTSAHGMHTTIGEIEAHEALTRLLRFAQFVSDRWETLTGVT